MILHKCHMAADKVLFLEKIKIKLAMLMFSNLELLLPLRLLFYFKIVYLLNIKLIPGNASELGASSKQGPCFILKSSLLLTHYPIRFTSLNI